MRNVLAAAVGLAMFAGIGWGTVRSPKAAWIACEPTVRAGEVIKGCWKPMPESAGAEEGERGGSG